MALNVGDKAPDFTVRSTERDSFNLYTELKNGPILLNFYIADFGINCTNYMMKFIEQNDRFTELGVKIVMINNDGMDNHKMFKSRLGAPWEFLFDEDKKVATEYGCIVGPGFLVSGFTNREFYLIDKDGTIKYIWKSPIPKQIPEVDEIVDGVKKSL